MNMGLSRKWTVRSDTVVNTVYIVTLDSEGVLSCSCPDFRFRCNVCKHISKVKMKLVGEKQKNKLPGVKQ